MNAILRFADRRPLVFSQAALAAWLLSVAVIVAAAAFILKTPITADLPQSLGALGATGILLLLASRLGWLGPMGITKLGSRIAWLVTPLIGGYLTLGYFYAFFGELEYNLAYVMGTQTAQGMLLRQVVVGFVEETVFRGFILYALVRVWGRSRAGMLAAVLVQAALFGLLHALQVLAGGPLTIVLLNILDTFVFGIWLGFLVLSVSSIWPAVFLHALANYVVLTKGLYSVWVEPEALQYVRATLFELPLVLLGIWLIWKVIPLPSISSPQISDPGADTP